jgi:hypothetical protein
MPNKQEDLANDQTSVNPFANTKGHSSMTQNPSRNHLTVEGNETKGSTPGGKSDEVRNIPMNKPRSNPQGNRPMSVDTNSPKKGPGRKAD